MMSRRIWIREWTTVLRHSAVRKKKRNRSRRCWFICNINDAVTSSWAFLFQKEVASHLNQLEILE
jgi:hypothetical protein